MGFVKFLSRSFLRSFHVSLDEALLGPSHENFLGNNSISPKSLLLWPPLNSDGHKDTCLSLTEMLFLIIHLGAIPGPGTLKPQGETPQMLDTPFLKGGVLVTCQPFLFLLVVKRPGRWKWANRSGRQSSSKRRPKDSQDL